MRSLPNTSPILSVDALPLAAGSAALLVEALLTDSAKLRSGVVVRAMRYDPPLVLWALCHLLRPHASDPVTLDRLANDFDHRFAKCLLGSPSAIGSDGDIDTQTQIRSANLAVESVRLAQRAARLAQSENEAVAQEAYLLGLLHNLSAWLSVFEPAAHENLRPRSVEELFSLLRPFLGSLESPSAQLAGESVLAAICEQADDGQFEEETEPTVRRHWTVAVGVSEHLMPLAERLFRLDQLESDFATTLEQDKLKAMYKLAAGAGHEINNPLGSIAGRAQLLLRDETDPERRRTLAKINSQAFRAHEMIADMMLFAKPPEPRCQLIDVSVLIDEVVAEMQEATQQREAEMVSTVEEGVSLLFVDAAQLMVALRAICTNSLEAMGHGGRIEIAVRHLASGETHPSGEAESLPKGSLLKGMVEIAVSDNGPGFAREDRSHLFDPFYSGREAGRGLGFGLSKCWRIVHNHGGAIDAESTPGQGATFRIKLPVA